MRTTIVAALLFAVPALAQHTHCDIKPWGPVELSPTATASYPITFGAQPTNLTFSNILIPLPAPPASGVAGCSYEVSDITALKVTLHFTGADLSFDSATVTGPGTPPGGQGPLNGGPYYFSSLVTSRTFSFPPHDLGVMGSILVDFPGATFSLTLAGGATTTIGPATLEAVTMQISGNHYYVPAPGTAALLGLGVLGACRRRR